MSDVAKLVSSIYLTKPTGTPYSHFSVSVASLALVRAKIQEAVIESTYAALVSYAEAIRGLGVGSVSWPIVKLYYSCFYSIRALLLSQDVIPFNCKGEMLLDYTNNKFLKGGNSSHHWNWAQFRKIRGLDGRWFISEDSEDSYAKLRGFREEVNYTRYFCDPNFHECLVSREADLSKRFRSYRDDDAFLYTYLDDHLAIAYPTKLIFYLDRRLSDLGISLDADKIAHVQKIWKLRDRFPMQ